MTSDAPTGTRGSPPAAGVGDVRAAAVRARGWGWQHAGRETPAVLGLDLDIQAGEKVLLVGPSGAGKSTLMHALAGVLQDDEDNASAGELLIDGLPAAAARGRTGLMQQDPETQVVQARVGDDVAFGAENLSVDPELIWPRVSESLQAVGLDLPLDHPTSSLSGGQKQRLALAGILAMRPGLVLLDEPTANLDPDGVLEVRDAVLEALGASGATMIIVEHRLTAWADAVDRVIVLEPGGGVAYQGAPARLFAPGPLRERLIDAGIWVPGHTPVLPARAPAKEPAAGLLSARRLAVSRTASGAPVVSGLDLRIDAGQALCITGANGAGKSTLALTLAGLLPERRGSVAALPALSGAQDLPEETEPVHPDRPYLWRAGELVGRIGTVFQEPEHQFVTTTVRAELAFGPRHARTPGSKTRLYTDAHITERVDELLDRLGLRHLADANPFTLSGGEKRRLSVATVLAARPRLLILDEPTFGQDANTWQELALLLREQLDEGVAVVAVTHDAAFAAALGASTFEVAADLRPVQEPGTPTQEEPATDPRAAGGMPGLEPDAGARASFFGRCNPLAKLAAVVLGTVPLIASLDLVTSSVVVLASLLLLRLAGIAPTRFLRRAWPLLVAALFAAWGTALVGNDAGAVLLNLGVATISDGSLISGVATGLRIFAVAVPAVIVLSSTDPTDLANALAQQARLPHRFVLGALAGMRLMGLLAEEWVTLGMARRARGVGAQGGFVQRLRANAGQSLGLMVQAIRRASRLAVTMEAKGFGGAHRTWARTASFSWRDGAMVSGGLTLGAVATTAAVLTGAWNLVWG
ncbi:ATP-binding cassette domain-containing protein [Arthrobacter rhombi]|uniref:ATP-binding cassette domain-containing protein n=1 Tax=Arthrobacter rhombi TaxID=71253 RepID=UPI003F93AF3E